MDNGTARPLVGERGAANGALAGRPLDDDPGPVLEPERGFVIATGIECSAPLVGGRRVDELAKTGHYGRWAEDLRLVRATGIRYLRYGLPIHVINPGPGVFDWAFSDVVMARMRELGITPILDLLHFGVPDDLREIGHPEVPGRLEAFARAVAERYPWVRHYTPVNEPYITALFSARVGWWNEQRSDEPSFVRALLTVGRAHVLAARAIRAIRPDAVLVTSESCQEHHPAETAAEVVAAFENELRFTSFELVYGRPLPGLIGDYLLANGATRDELAWFERNGSDAGAIVGNDYYEGSEQLVDRHGATRPAGVRTGYAALARAYHDRLGLPLMHTETNMDRPRAAEWLAGQWADVADLRRTGVPIRGFTWYGFVNHVDWDTALRQDQGRENPCGLVGLDRRPNPVYATFRAIAAAVAEEEWVAG